MSLAEYQRSQRWLRRNAMDLYLRSTDAVKVETLPHCEECKHRHLLGKTAEGMGPCSEFCECKKR